MRYFWLISVMALAIFQSCMVPYPLDEEQQDSKTPPRFLRDYLDPQFYINVSADSSQPVLLTIVVEDPDIYDEIPFRIYKDYALASDSQKQSTILVMDKIPGVDQDLPESDYGKNVRVLTYPISQSYFCDSLDETGDMHTIEMVIADAFDNSSSVRPFWRATVGPSDVWSFTVVCVKSNKNKDVEVPNE
ncbi:MAG: hypothetical protein JXR95_00045 [Deltaproteobacteria bacterium]|nr:hypothetical protein [Deltaproteobacteria bacterium]